MAGELEKPDEPDRGSDEPVRYRELGIWERVAAGVAGLLVLAAGFVTLFLAKNNGAVRERIARGIPPESQWDDLMYGRTFVIAEIAGDQLRALLGPGAAILAGLILSLAGDAMTIWA
jgi:hypothetical protein